MNKPLRIMEAGPLVTQPRAAAQTARIIMQACLDLWDTCVLQDSTQMWEDTRHIASRLLAACPMDPKEGP